MGIAVLSGVIDSLDTSSRLFTNPSKWESHTPGTLTPVGPPDASVPTEHIACVSREASALGLRKVFDSLGAMGEAVQIFASRNLQAVQQSDVVLLWYELHYSFLVDLFDRDRYSCKPQLAHTILNEQGMKEALDGKLLISILAGVTMRQITDWVLPSTRVVRAMPNTPCKVCASPHLPFAFVLLNILQIREGMTVVSNLPPSAYEESDRAIILKIFSSIGRCRFLEEKHFDACTALSGSGPAFACIFMEAMADGGVMMGLPRAEALELAAQSKSSQNGSGDCL